MYYAQFIRPEPLGGRTGYAISSDGLHWQAKNRNLTNGQDAEILKVSDNLYYMYYGPAGYFDSEGCDIRLAILSANLSDLPPTRAFGLQKT